MDKPGGFSKHFWRSHGMARACGVRLSAEVASGRLRRSDVAQMVAECCLCPRGTSCADWLATDAPGNRMPPGWCPLAPRLTALCPHVPAAG